MNTHVLFSALCNSSRANKKWTNIKKSKINISILNVLYKEGYISGYRIGNNIVKVYWLQRHDGGIVKCSVLSKNNIAYYVSYSKLKTYKKKHAMGIVIISTSKGIMSHRESIRLKLGGVLIATIL